jgi:hypothetical protein
MRPLYIQQSKVLSTVENDPYLLDLLAVATSSSRRTIFIEALIKELPEAFSQFSKEPVQLFAIFTSWFGKFNNAHTLFSGTSAALKARQQYFMENRFNKRQFISAIGLDWTSVQKATFLSTVQVIHLSPLTAPYPPKYHWMVESDAIADKWRYYIEEGKQPDERAPRYPLFHVDPLKLQKDVSSDESIIVFDKTTHKLEMLILRNFSNHPALLDHLGNVIRRAVEYRKSMRVSLN